MTANSKQAPRLPDSGEVQAPQVFKDPVCGMEVTAQKSYSAMHRDCEFRFCSLSCLEKFAADPEAFVRR